MRILIMIMLMAGAGPAMAATIVCKPTFGEFMEFACVTKEPAVSVASFCEVMNRQGGPFRWSRTDTEETKNRADLINAAGKRACGWGRK